MGMVPLPGAVVSPPRGPNLALNWVLAISADDNPAGNTTLRDAKIDSYPRRRPTRAAQPPSSRSLGGWIWRPEGGILKKQSGETN
jgi:hypothetical protein